MEFKGTKGEWSNFIYFEDFYSVESDVGQVICNTLCKDDIDLANAKLISCAPEMLELLIKIKQYNHGVPEWLLVDSERLINKAIQNH
jgi:hypothetical protein